MPLTATACASPAAASRTRPACSNINPGMSAPWRRLRHRRRRATSSRISRSAAGAPWPRMAAAARAPNTSPSSSELLASRLAPWTPVHATSPAANRSGIDVRPSRSVPRRPSRSAPPGSTGMRSRARSRPACATGLGDGREPRRARIRRRVRQRQVRPADRSRLCSRTMARATTSRGARSPPGRSASMKRSPAALTSRAPSPRSASDSRKRGAPGDVERRRMELHELEIGRRARRPATPSPCRRRSQPPGWWSRGTPGRRRRSRAARRGADASRSSPARSRTATPSTRRPRRAAPSRARRCTVSTAAPRTRAPRARGRSRGRSHRAACSTRRTLCAPSRARAGVAVGVAIERARPSRAARARSAGPPSPARRPPAPRTSRRRRRACPRVQIRANRRRRPPRRCRPARSRCCSRSGSALVSIEDVAAPAQVDRGAQAGDAAADDEEIGAQRPPGAILPCDVPRHCGACDTACLAIRIDVATASGAYPIVIGARRSRAAWPPTARRRRRAAAAHPRVEPGRVAAQGPRRARRSRHAEPILMPDGERSKTCRPSARIYDALVGAAPIAAPRVIAVGGGVIGDMAGFAAATFLRGITAGAGADDAARAGRQRDRRQGRRQPRARQEPDWRVSSAGARRRSIRSCSTRCRDASSAPASTK